MFVNTHVCYLSHLLFWLFWDCNLNGVQLCGMAPPHSSLAVTEPLQDQQTKQDCINLPENLEKKIGKGDWWVGEK